MLTPKDYIGSLMELAQDRRGEFIEMKFITENRASITYALPLAEVTTSFSFFYFPLFTSLKPSSCRLCWLLFYLLVRFGIFISQMVGDFFDQLKSRSKGYASMEYTFIG